MKENVNTGGSVSFHYSKGWKPKRDVETEIEIKEAYEKYYKKRRIKKIVGWIILIIIVGIGIYLLLRK